MVKQGISSSRCPRLYWFTYHKAPTAEVTQPEATLFDSDNREWLAHANEGVLNTATQALTLSGDARLLAPTEGWQLDTELLHYDGVARHVWSEAPAVFQQPPQRMSASRMDVWLDDSQVRLTDNVRGHHSPRNTKSLGVAMNAFIRTALFALAVPLSAGPDKPSPH